MTTIRLLAIDIGTRNLGWAVMAPGEQPSSGVYHPPVVGRDLGWLLIDIRSWMVPLLKNNGITTISYEGPILNPSNNMMTIRKVFAIGGQLEVIASDADLPIEEELPGKVRKHFLAPHKVPTHTKEIKEAVVARCRQLGWRPEMDDDADALALGDYTLAMKTSVLAKKIGALL
jgi:Holliday junction resolvasome RuvABC endonuclease subunit